MEVLTKNIWVRNSKFDLSLISGGAIISFTIVFILLHKPLYIPLFFWIWISLFEGTHIWATISRTYFDKEFALNNKRLLLTSLIFFIIPYIILELNASSKSLPFNSIYTFCIFIWALFHIARQHYGFISIYSNKINLPPKIKQKVCLSLYSAIVIPQLYYLFTLRLPNFVFHYLPRVNVVQAQFFIAKILIYLSLISLLAVLIFLFRFYETYKKRSLAILNYIIICFLFYSCMYYYITHQDNFYQSALGINLFLLVTIMNSLFHNIQYHAFIWHYSQKRYKDSTFQNYGLASLINKKTTHYLLFCLVTCCISYFIASNLGLWPNHEGFIETQKFSQLSYILFFGLVSHHFYVDQKIWKPSKQKELNDYLK